MCISVIFIRLESLPDLHAQCNHLMLSETHLQHPCWDCLISRPKFQPRVASYPKISVEFNPLFEPSLEKYWSFLAKLYDAKMELPHLEGDKTWGIIFQTIYWLGSKVPVPFVTSQTKLYPSCLFWKVEPEKEAQDQVFTFQRPRQIFKKHW